MVAALRYDLDSIGCSYTCAAPLAFKLSRSTHTEE